MHVPARHPVVELFVIGVVLTASFTNLGWFVSPFTDATLLVPSACEALGLGQLFSGLLMLSGCSRGPGALCGAVAFSGAAVVALSAGALTLMATAIGMTGLCAVVASSRQHHGLERALG